MKSFNDKSLLINYKKRKFWYLFLNDPGWEFCCRCQHYSSLISNRASEDDDSPETNQCEYGNCQKCPQSIDNIVKADVGMSWGYLFSLRMIIGYFGEKLKERKRDHIRKCEDFSVWQYLHIQSSFPFENSQTEDKFLSFEIQVES